MQERHTNRKQYFKELAQTSRDYYVPYIEQFISITKDVKVLEVGCGEGGNLVPFAKTGCEVIGVDLAVSRISQAKEFFAEGNLKGTFIASDIFKLKDLEKQFDLILLHDVIEHIGNKEQFLLKMKPYLKDNTGIIFIGFPAWQMPFGGHQQIAKSKFISHFPFIHLCPNSLYKAFLSLFGERVDTQKELLEIKKTRCSIERFFKTVRKTNYQIINSRLYFINPHYKAKFGLTPVKLNGVIAKIPYIRNFFSTSCFYIMKNA